MCKSSKVGSSCSSNCGLINWNDSSIWVSNKMGSSITQMSYTMSSSNRGISSMSISSMSYNSLSCKMGSTGSNYSRFICRDNSSIRMSYKVGVKVKRSPIAIAMMSRNCCITVASMGNSSMAVSCMSYYSLSSKMFSSCSSNSGFINRNNSSIGMSHQTVEWSSRRHSQAGGKNLFYNNYVDHVLVVMPLITRNFMDDALSDAKVRMKLNVTGCVLPFILLRFNCIHRWCNFDIQHH